MRERAEIEAVIALLAPESWDPFNAGAAEALKWALGGDSLALDLIAARATHEGDGE